MSRPAPHPFLDHSGLLAFAHRGGALEFPENTLSAFEGAVALGFRYLETDVHATEDGVLLAFHDDILDRVTDRTGNIAAMPFTAVQKARINGCEPIPLMADLLDAFPDTRFNIDPKADTSVEPLISLLKEKGALDRVCVGSFSEKRLNALRAEFGDRICTSMAGVQTARLKFKSWGVPSWGFSARCAQVPEKAGRLTLVDRAFCDTAHAVDMQVHVWTIDEEEQMERLIDAGVDGLMTDRPSVLKAVLERRGLWS